MTNTERSTAVGLAGLLVSFCAQASLGIYEQGNGVKAMGMGGVSYVGVDESTVLSANPALAISQGSRFDLGNDLLIVSGGTRIRGNAAGPDEYYDSSGKSLFPIPQLGLTIPIAEHWAFGAAAFAAGIGPDYPRSPYARFAQGQGADVEARSATALNTLKVAGISLALAREIIPGQSIGLSANLQHTSLSTEGTAPFASMSVAPDFVGNQGQHGGFGVSFTAGWTGTITPWLSGGLSYRSKAWQQRIEQYRGLLPDGGRLELPAIFGGALEARPSESWRLAVEYQHYDYSGSNGFGNTIDLLFAGVPLGAKDGPGFGWRDQNVYKFGFQYLATPQVTLRAGVSYATSLLPRSQTLFNGLAPATPQWNLGVGGTLGLTTNSEVSFVMATTEHNTVRGKDSIPDAFGGGEADIDFKCFNIGISYGRRFGKSRAGAGS